MAITLAEPREHRLLKNIERETGRKLAVEKIPTIADLRNRRMELTLSTLREAMTTGDVSDDLDQFRVVVETLTDDFDLMEIALAAVKLAHEATAGPDGDDHEIPDAVVPSGKGGASKKRDSKKPDKHRPAKGSSRRSEGMTRLYVGAGRESGVRPKDLVGAIAGETKLSGKDIGAIEIADRFSLVEVPDGAVDEVLWAMRRTTIKGRKTKVRRERFES